MRASGSGEVYTETSTVKILLCGDSLSVKVKRKEAKEFELTIPLRSSIAFSASGTDPRVTNPKPRDRPDWSRCTRCQSRRRVKVSRGGEENANSLIVNNDNFLYSS